MRYQNFRLNISNKDQNDYEKSGILNASEINLIYDNCRKTLCIIIIIAHLKLIMNLPIIYLQLPKNKQTNLILNVTAYFHVM